MAPPAVHPTTRRIWDSLPEHYRVADARQADPDYPLLRWLSLIGDQLGELEDLVDRINYVTPGDGGSPGDTSDLVDPDTADAAWLPFIAQLDGVTLPSNATEAAQREAIGLAPTGWRAATKQAIADAAVSALTGGRYIVVTDHYGGDPWAIEVRTRTSETPDADAVLAAILAAGAKPAGHIIVPTRYGASWAEIGDRFPTWADIVGRTWLDVLETTSTPTAPIPVADSIDARWKVRAVAADTLEARWAVLVALTAVADTFEGRWRVRTRRVDDILANDAPLIYLDFNDAAGTNADDSTANNRDGTYAGGVTLNQAPIIPSDTAGKAVLLDGVDDRITTNYQPFATSKTFRGVCKRTSHANRHTLMGSTNGVILSVEAGGNDVKWWPDASVASALWSAAWPGDNVVVEWVLKHNETAHTAELLINGVSKGVVTGLDPYRSGPGKVTVGGRGASGDIDTFAGVYDAFDIVDGAVANATLAARYAAHF